jgi:Cdc6-like AAA superfamily ATPase
MSQAKIVCLTDHATDRDLLRYEDFQNALHDIVTQAETPLTVGVFGPWGSGKTSLMQMVYNQIAGKSPATRPVWFTAWKYDRHEALWRAFILRVLDALYPRADVKDPAVAWAERPRLTYDQLTDPNQKEQVKLLDRLAASLYANVAWQEGGQWKVELSGSGKEAAKLPAFMLLNLAGMGNLTKSLEVDPDLAQVIHREIQTAHMEQLNSMEQFEKAFRQAIQAVLGKDGRLIVFVDDLDRCLPEKALEVLEAIKLFLEVSGVIFILGMDQDVIRQGIEAR